VYEWLCGSNVAYAVACSSAQHLECPSSLLPPRSRLLPLLLLQVRGWTFLSLSAPRRLLPTPESVCVGVYVCDREREKGREGERERARARERESEREKERETKRNRETKRESVCVFAWL